MIYTVLGDEKGADGFENHNASNICMISVPIDILIVWKNQRFGILIENSAVYCLLHQYSHHYARYCSLWINILNDLYVANPLANYQEQHVLDLLQFLTQLLYTTCDMAISFLSLCWLIILLPSYITLQILGLQSVLSTTSKMSRSILYLKKLLFSGALLQELSFHD